MPYYPHTCVILCTFVNTGLGLSIAKQIIALHGGKVGVSSERIDSPPVSGGGGDGDGAGKQSTGEERACVQVQSLGRSPVHAAALSPGAEAGYEGESDQFYTTAYDTTEEVCDGLYETKFWFELEMAVGAESAAAGSVTFTDASSMHVSTIHGHGPALADARELNASVESYNSVRRRPSADLVKSYRSGWGGDTNKIHTPFVHSGGSVNVLSGNNHGSGFGNRTGMENGNGGGNGTGMENGNGNRNGNGNGMGNRNRDRNGNGNADGDGTGLGMSGSHTVFEPPSTVEKSLDSINFQSVSPADYASQSKRPFPLQTRSTRDAGSGSAARAEERKASSQARWSPAGLRVLVVEDNDINRQLVVRILERKGTWRHPCCEITAFTAFCMEMV